MARSRKLKTLKHQQQEVDQESSIPTPAKRKIKRKNLLHGCKLCPEKCFPVSARSKIRPANPSVEGHVLKEHPGMEYTDLTRRWGHHLIYEDGSVERVPLIDDGDVQEEALRTSSRPSLTKDYGVDPLLGLSQEDRDLYDTLSNDQSTAPNDHAGPSFDSTASQYATFPMPVSLGTNNLDRQSEDWFSVRPPPQTDNECHATRCGRSNALSDFDDLPVLDLDEYQFKLRIADIGPFDPHDPLDYRTSARIDPLLMVQEELANVISPPDFNQYGARNRPELASNNMTMSDQMSLDPGSAKVQKISGHAIPRENEQDQVDGPGLCKDTITHNFATFELMQKRAMEQRHLQLMLRGNNILLIDNHAPSQNFDPQETTAGDQGQSFKNIGDGGLSHGNWEAGASFSSSSEVARSHISTQSHVSVSGVSVSRPALRTPPAITASRFKIPTTPASAYNQAPKSDRSSGSQFKQDNSVKQVKIPTPSSQKREASAAHLQTPTPKSRRSKTTCSPPAPPHILSDSQPQARSSVDPHQPTLNQLTFIPISLKYNSRGPLVFPKSEFNKLHPLDQQALTGHHGARVTDLSRFAFFGHDANDANYGRTREKQLIDMVGYLRLQRDFLYNKFVNGQQGVDANDSGANGAGNGGKDSMA